VPNTNSALRGAIAWTTLFRRASCVGHPRISVATIDSTGLLTPRHASTVNVEATAVGWRTSRAIVTIEDPVTDVLFDEDWSSGLGARWRPYGVPNPVVLSDARLGHAFPNNGDGSFFSGAYMARTFDTRDGLWVEANVSTPLTATESQDFVVWLFAKLQIHSHGQSGTMLLVTVLQE